MEEQDNIVEENNELSELEVKLKEFTNIVDNLSKLDLVKNDIVFFRNGEIGRIDAISIDYDSLMYRLYVKITDNLIITLNENFKNVDGNKRYDVAQILSPSFNEKIIIEFEDLFLTKQEAQEELTTLKGQTVIIE